mgnify:CR=1 FL=1
MGQGKEEGPQFGGEGIQLGWRLDAEANILKDSLFPPLREKMEELISGYALYQERPKETFGHSQADFLAVVLDRSSGLAQEFMFGPENWQEKPGQRNPQFKFGGLLVILENGQDLFSPDFSEQLEQYLPLVRSKGGLVFIVEGRVSSLSKEEKEARKRWLRERGFVKTCSSLVKIDEVEKAVVSRGRKRKKTKRKPVNLLDTRWRAPILRAKEQILVYLSKRGWRVLDDEGFHRLITASRMPPQDARLILSGEIRGMKLEHNLCGCVWAITEGGERQRLHRCNLGDNCAGPPPEAAPIEKGEEDKKEKVVRGCSLVKGERESLLKTLGIDQLDGVVNSRLLRQEVITPSSAISRGKIDWGNAKPGQVFDFDCGCRGVAINVEWPVLLPDGEGWGKKKEVGIVIFETCSRPRHQGQRGNLYK